MLTNSQFEFYKPNPYIWPNNAQFGWGGKRTRQLTFKPQELPPQDLELRELAEDEILAVVDVPELQSPHGFLTPATRTIVIIKDSLAILKTADFQLLQTIYGKTKVYPYNPVNAPSAWI